MYRPDIICQQFILISILSHYHLSQLCTYTKEKPKYSARHLSIEFCLLWPQRPQSFQPNGYFNSICELTHIHQIIQQDKCDLICGRAIILGYVLRTVITPLLIFYFFQYCRALSFVIYVKLSSKPSSILYSILWRPCSTSLIFRGFSFNFRS